MIVETLTKASPNGSDFTLADRTLIQACILGSSVVTSGCRVIIEVDVGGGNFEYYRTFLETSKPTDFYLAPNTYRASLENAVDSTSVKVMISPATAN